MSLKRSCKKEAEILGKKLLEKNYTMATAESCTGGLIGAAVTAVAGSSAWFKGGIIAYNNAVKTNLLDVGGDVLDACGAVSEEAVRAMAQGAARILKTDCAIAVSGIAGPGGGTKDKPVGLVYIGVYCKGTTMIVRNRFLGDREEVREQAVAAGLRSLITMLSADD